jgi:hypothetical protein
MLPWGAWTILQQIGAAGQERFVWVVRRGEEVNLGLGPGVVVLGPEGPVGVVEAVAVVTEV